MYMAINLNQISETPKQQNYLKKILKNHPFIQKHTTVQNELCLVKLCNM